MAAAESVGADQADHLTAESSSHPIRKRPRTQQHLAERENSRARDRSSGLKRSKMRADRSLKPILLKTQRTYAAVPGPGWS